MAKLKKVNIVSSIIAMLIISISGIGTYAVKGLLADIKTQAAKVKAEVFKELENYYSAKIKTEFEEMKNSVKEDLKRTTDFINTVNKENLAQEIRNICAKETIKAEEILREQLRSMKLEKLNE